jgi:hypothetical protein
MHLKFTTLAVLLKFSKIPEHSMSSIGCAAECAMTCTLQCQQSKSCSYGGIDTMTKWLRGAAQPLYCVKCCDSLRHVLQQSLSSVSGCFSTVVSAAQPVTRSWCCIVCVELLALTIADHVLLCASNCIVLAAVC